MNIDFGRVLLYVVAFALATSCETAQMKSADVDSSTQTGKELNSEAWIGDTHLLAFGTPVPSGAVLVGIPVEVSTQTHPVGAVSSVTLFCSDPDFMRVRSIPMRRIANGVGPFGNNSEWRADVPPDMLVAGEHISYWIRADAADGAVRWDSRGGVNFQLVVRSELALLDDLPPEAWRFTGVGSGAIMNGVATMHGGGGLGLLWCTVPTPANFSLSVEWQLSAINDNSGVMVRFPHVEGKGYANPAWVPVHDGYEIQIDEIARPSGASVHGTGAIYDQPGQVRTPIPSRGVGQWNQLVVSVRGQDYEVHINGQRVTTWTRAQHPAGGRGNPSSPGDPRFVGLQAHSGAVLFRNARIQTLE